MEFDIQSKLTIDKTKKDFSKQLGKTVNLYKYPPDGKLNLEECQDLFRQRLEALQIFEKYPDYINPDKAHLVSNSLSEIKSHVYKSNCMKFKANDPDHRFTDHCSHMLLRLFCCYNPSLWDWFKVGERRILHYRLLHDLIPSSDQLEMILQSFEFDFDRVSSHEIAELKNDKIIGWNLRERDHDEIFKVHFINALKFIAKRSVALKNGYAFLTRSEIVSVICDVFVKHIENELIYGSQHIDTNHSQVKQLLESLDIVFADYQDRVNEEQKKQKRDSQGDHHNPFAIDIIDIEDISKSHYPPCMRYIHESLTQDHHLKHQGRVLYGTFLRSGGVDMESAIDFWRKEFTKKIPNDKFERDYKYNIRHLYGREGHRKALTCFSCDKIINDCAPGPTDKHGCPFKHFDDKNLKDLLVRYGLKENELESVLIHRKEPKLACSHYFERLKGDLPSEPIKNPIHFYYESKRIHMKLEEPCTPPECKETITESHPTPS